MGGIESGRRDLMDIVAQAEQVKYERMWREVPGYRRHSPGESLATEFRARLGVKSGESVIDVGCGTGRAAAILAAKGLNVTCLDIAENAYDAGVKLPFVQGCLWDLPEGVARFDWFFCADVMEHIPEDQVEAALDNILRIAARGGMFQIAHFNDSWGAQIGESLHLTVKPRTWWEPKILSRWKEVYVDGPPERSLFFCRR